MPNRRLLPATAIALILALAAAPTAQAAAGAPATGQPHRPSPLRWLAALPWPLVLAALALDNGCHLDPSGLACGLVREASGLDNGCHLDPDGRCLAAPAALPPGGLDSGCHLDPDGCPQ